MEKAQALASDIGLGFAGLAELGHLAAQQLG
jgi:hypothetical protein